MSAIMGVMEPDKDTMKNEMGERLRELREGRKLSVAALAKMSGISRDHIYRIERGERRSVGANVLSALANALKTTTDDLVEPSSDRRAPAANGVPIPVREIALLVDRLNRMHPEVRKRVVPHITGLLDLLQFAEKIEPQSTPDTNATMIELGKLDELLSESGLPKGYSDFIRSEAARLAQSAARK